jgi:hypothetical protein
MHALPLARGFDQAGLQVTGFPMDPASALR